jgi:hypothetical protein
MQVKYTKTAIIDYYKKMKNTIRKIIIINSNFKTSKYYFFYQNTIISLKSYAVQKTHFFKYLSISIII